MLSLSCNEKERKGFCRAMNFFICYNKQVEVKWRNTMDGILPLWKERGQTSHDCVFKLRKILKTKKSDTAAH